MVTDGVRSRLDSITSGRVRFQRIKPLVAFLVAFTAYAIVSNKSRARLFGPDVSAALDIVGTIGGISVMGVVVWLVLRHEGLRPGDIGFAPALALPAVVAVGGLWLGLNAVGGGLAAVTDAQSSITLAYDASLPVVVGLAVKQYLFVGLLEELAFRGYLQNKLIALLGGGDDRARTALGIATASLVFAAMHIPNRIFVDNLAPGELTVSLVHLFAAAVVLGIVYEATRNVFLVGFLHGTGNLWPLVVDPWAWPNWLFLVWVGGSGVLLGATVWSYRRWVVGTRTTVLGRAIGLRQ